MLIRLRHSQKKKLKAYELFRPAYFSNISCSLQLAVSQTRFLACLIYKLVTF